MMHVNRRVPWPCYMRDHHSGLFFREGDAPRTVADECREQAAKALNPLDRERWLKIAEDWVRMAQEADDKAEAH
jgi:hypothetical protein